jgi:hypothetical protein
MPASIKTTKKTTKETTKITNKKNHRQKRLQTTKNFPETFQPKPLNTVEA